MVIKNCTCKVQLVSKLSTCGHKVAPNDPTETRRCRWPERWKVVVRLDHHIYYKVSSHVELKHVVIAHTKGPSILHFLSIRPRCFLRRYPLYPRTTFGGINKHCTVELKHKDGIIPDSHDWQFVKTAFWNTPWCERKLERCFTNKCRKTVKWQKMGTEHFNCLTFTVKTYCWL